MIDLIFIRDKGGTIVANWDVFHADRLELERGLSAEAIRCGPGARRLAGRRPCPARRVLHRLGTNRRHPGTDLSPTARPASASLSQPLLGQPTRAIDPDERLPDFEEVQPSLEKIVPPPKSHAPTLLPESSSSDVAFPVIEAESTPQVPRPRSAPADSPRPRLVLGRGRRRG